jgi:hypothetical protein
MCKTRRLVLLLGFVSAWSAASAQDVLLVANKSVQISAISAADLRAIFLGTKTRFADGAHALPVVLRGGPVHEVFLTNYLGENSQQFRMRWQNAVFTGQGAMPKTCDSEAALIEYVAATPGAIGYVSRISPQDNVKTLVPHN